MRYRLRMAIGLLALAIACAAAVMAPYVLRRAIDSLREGVSTQKLLVFAGLTIGLQTIDSGLRFITRVYVSGSSRKMEYDLRNDVYTHIQSLDQKFFHNQKLPSLDLQVRYGFNGVGGDA